MKQLDYTVMSTVEKLRRVSVINYSLNGLNTREDRPMCITLGTENKNTRGPLAEGYCMSCELNELQIMQRGKGVYCHVTKS